MRYYLSQYALLFITVCIIICHSQKLYSRINSNTRSFTSDAMDDLIRATAKANIVLTSTWREDQAAYGKLFRTSFKFLCDNKFNN